jgi:hypothetical protein
VWDVQANEDMWKWLVHKQCLDIWFYKRSFGNSVSFWKIHLQYNLQWEISHWRLYWRWIFQKREENPNGYIYSVTSSSSGPENVATASLLFKEATLYSGR